MANYYDQSLQDVTDTRNLGMGGGETPEGESRVCISLQGTPINPGLDPGWKPYNWVALTEACAHDLYELLKDHFERCPFEETEDEYFKRHYGVSPTPAEVVSEAEENVRKALREHLGRTITPEEAVKVRTACDEALSQMTKQGDLHSYRINQNGDGFLVETYQPSLVYTFHVSKKPEEITATPK